MKINTKKITSLAVATMIAVGSTSSFAASFTDKNLDKHWAFSYIESGKKLGLIEGFEDGTFRPEQSITRIQTISLVARVLNLPPSEVEKAKSKYQATLIAKKVPEWAIGDLSVALSQGIIDTNVVSKLIDSKGAQTLSQREEVAIYLARALELQKEVENQGSNIKLPFKDTAKITKEAIPYVYVMYKYDIINGDDTGNFNPKKAIKRSEMAKLLSLSNDYIEATKKKDDEVKPDPKPEPKPEENLKLINGTILAAFPVGYDKHVVIRTSSGKEENYKLDSKSILRIDGKIVSHSDLKEGLNAKVEVIEGKGTELGFIRTLDVESTVEVYHGVISDIRDSGVKTFYIEYKENGITRRKIFTLDSDAKISIDGERSSFSDLRDKDILSVEVKNGKVTEIDAKSYIRDINGILKNIDIESKQIEIENKDGNRVRYQLHKDVDIIRSGRATNLSQLRKGDQVKVRIEDKIVTRLDAEIVRSTVEGKLTRKIISLDRDEITVLNYKTGREETYSVPYDANIELDNRKTKLDDLELGYDVKIDLEGEEVVYVRGQATILNKEHLGRITYIDRDSLEMRTREGKVLKVKITNARIKDRSGASISDRDLYKDDEILVTGELYRDEIVATEIMKRSI